jgi:Holliday junction resolvasome RuvABC endonuclease subunit
MMSSDLTILGLDMSSTRIGVVVTCGTRVQLHRTWHLPGDIASRCFHAQEMVRNQLALLSNVDLVAVESPVSRFAKSLIPQARVSGAVLAVIADRGLLWVEIAPKEAKKALTGKGTASKQEMCAAAGLASEHESDALGLAMAASRKNVTKELA